MNGHRLTAFAAPLSALADFFVACGTFTARAVLPLVLVTVLLAGRAALSTERGPPQ